MFWAERKMPSDMQFHTPSRASLQGIHKSIFWISVVFESVDGES